MSIKSQRQLTVADRDSVVTHTHKTVRRQFIDVRLPPPPKDDAEAFIVRNQSGDVIVSLAPADFNQFIAVLKSSYDAVVNPVLAGRDL